MKQLFYILLFMLPISACQNEGDIKLPNDVRWVTQSSEYTSLCEQIYSSASSVLQNQFEGVDLPVIVMDLDETCLLYTSPSPRDATLSRMPSSA